jgi:hypothetical protein
VNRAVELYLERLVIPTELRVDPVALQDALEHELSRLVLERGIPPAWRADGLHLDSLSSRADATPTPATLGSALAETIHGGGAR